MDQPLHATSLVEFERLYVKPVAGAALIVGSKIYPGREDRRKGFARATGIDMLPGEGVDIVQDLEHPLPIGQLLSFDHVECMSVLEHCERPWLVAANIERMMRSGASIFISVPFMWRVHAYPSDYWRITPRALGVLFPGVRWEKTAICSQRIEDGERVKAMVHKGHPYFPRSETAGFGYKV